MTSKNEKYQPLIDDKIKKTTTQIIPQSKYDPFKVPPNFDEAQAHYLATRIAKPNLNSSNHTHDPASGLVIENTPLGLCSSRDELNFLSPGYPMYFQWIRFSIFIGLIIILCSGVHNLQAFSQGAACIDEDVLATQTAMPANYPSDNRNASNTNNQPSNQQTTQTSSTGTGTSAQPTNQQASQPTTTTTNTPAARTAQPTQTTTTQARTTPTTNTATGTQTNTAQTRTTTTSVKRFLEVGTADQTTEENDDYVDKRLENLEVCPRNWINKFSLANQVDDEVELEKADIYNFFTIVILLLIMQFIRKIQKQTAVICDERAITASDFTAKVTNLPQNFTDQEDIDEEIRKFFVDFGAPGIKCNVQQVSVCYNCSDIVTEEAKLKEAIEKRAQLLAKKKTSKTQLVSDDDIRKFEAQIEDHKKNILTLSNKFKEGLGVSKQFEGEAYVTFETQQELQAVIKHWKLGRLARLKESLSSTSQYKFRRNVPRVVEAPEPSDVYWENAGTAAATRMTLKTITNIITLIVLAAGFYTVFMINSVKLNLLANLNEQQESAENKSFIVGFYVKAISMGASVVVVIINQILNFVIRFLTQREKYSTWTEFQSAYAQRLALCQFLNTAVITFAVAIYFRNVSGPGGLTYTAFFIFVTNVVVQCGMVIFSPATIMYYMKKKSIDKDKNNCYLTQEQLNAAYKMPEFDFATRYAGYAKTIMSACFFAPLVPLVMVVATVGIIIEYSLDKYVMLRHRSRGKSVGTELAFEFVEFLEYCLVLFSLGNFLANVNVTNFHPSEEILTMMGVAIGILNAILPMGRINTALFPGKDEALTNEKYSEVKNEFYEDYNHSNPATEVAAANMCRIGGEQHH